MIAHHVMTNDDAQNLAAITSEIYIHPKWKPSAQHKRVRLLLAMFANLEQRENAPYPTLDTYIPMLAEAANVHFQFADEFFLWLLNEGHIVPVTSTTVAFSWHAYATSQGVGGETAS